MISLKGYLLLPVSAKILNAAVEHTSNTWRLLKLYVPGSSNVKGASYLPEQEGMPSARVVANPANSVLDSSHAANAGWKIKFSTQL